MISVKNSTVVLKAKLIQSDPDHEQARVESANTEQNPVCLLTPQFNVFYFGVNLQIFSPYSALKMSSDSIWVWS